MLLQVKITCELKRENYRSTKDLLRDLLGFVSPEIEDLFTKERRFNEA